MRMPALAFVIGLLFLIPSAPALCQEDIEGGTDIPYFTRMPNFYIESNDNRDFDRYTFYDGKKLVAVEGVVHQTTYRLKEGLTNPPSDLQMRRNYINAIKSKGGTVLAEATFSEYGDDRDNGTIVTGRFLKDGKEIWVEVYPWGGDWLRITVVEKQAMKQEITATEMLEAISRDGFIALDIHFDTGKSVIKDESRPIIDQIIALMNTSPSLNLSVEGHTDNVGDAKSNKTLSEQRAKAVTDALVAGGVAASRLKSAGFGQEKPVADNRTEEGRAKNRRVELVKQ